MEPDPTVVARLRAGGCVFAEEEASVLASAASSVAELDALVARRVAGEPLEQVVGWASFAGLRILVDPGVFVPRRRSEYLVSIASGGAIPPRPPLRLGGLPVPPDPPGPPAGGRTVIVDVCCGTGALGLAVWEEFVRGGELHAADLDPAAVACARRNVEPAGGRVYHGDLFEALPDSLRGRVDVLICNAPYVPSSEVEFMPAEAREHEALVALDGGPDGLAVLRRVAAAAPEWLAPGGVLLVETSSRQAPTMAAAVTAAGLAAEVHTDDEYGATVVTGGRQPSSPPG
jgi:release factor glutamine methyltransferase